MKLRILVVFSALVGLLMPALLTRAIPADAAASTTIWPSSAVPAILTDPDTTGVELGVKFRSDVAGTITGIRFYKGPSNSGTHTGSLWSSSGQRLATATFSNETASGWQQVAFSTPIAISANTTYIASYYAPNGRYSVTENYFTNTSYYNAPLRALSSGTTGNGVYKYGASGFPTQTYRGSNYWVDVVFVPTAPATPTPTPKATATPVATATNTPPPTATATPPPHHESPTPTPTATTPQEQPVAGQTCPAWVHDRYTITGPDGKTYPTWHPVIDRQYGCYFRHEHGSDPAKVPGAKPPAFAYGTPGHMTESHVGFKVKALHLENGVKVLAMTHFGTAHPEIAVCQRYHHANFQFVKDGVLVADLTFMADFGAARHNETDVPLDHPCPDPDTGEMLTQAQISARSNGVRLNPVGTNGPFYYPWRMDTTGNSMGFRDGGFTVNTPTVVAACKDMRCYERVVIGSTGAWAFASAQTGWGVRDNPNLPDVFYTDHHGKAVAAGTPNAIRQYVKAGTDIRLTNYGDTCSYYPDKRGAATQPAGQPYAYGDYIYTQLCNGDRNIADNHAAAVNPGGILQGDN